MSDISTDEGYDQSQQQGRPSDALKSEAQAVSDMVGDTAQSIKQEAAHFAESARDKANEQVDRSKDAVTTAIGDFADAIRKAGEDLAGKDQTMAARLASQAADGLQTFSRAVSEHRPEDMLDAVRRFGRENPTAFLAGAVLAGVALGRFARSSATHESDAKPASDTTSSGGVTAGLAASPVTTSEPSEPGLDTASFLAGALGSEGGVGAEPQPVGLGVLGDDDRDADPSAPKTAGAF
jgi:hypothetical protein